MTDKSSNAPKPHRCAVCGFDNPQGALNCANCGTPLLNSGRPLADARRVFPPKIEAKPEPQQDDGKANPGTGSPTMQVTRSKCPNCGHQNRAGTIFCDNCGANLQTGDQPNIGTASFDKGDAQNTLVHSNEEKASKPTSKVVPHLSTEEIRAVQTAGADVFEDDMVLRMEVAGASTPILIYPSTETTIGRRDPVSNTVPDVDLTAYAGYRMGVSRQHAVLRLRSKILDIRDLGSSNGTFVNGVRLIPHQPHLLKDGDELGLGKMVLKIFFQSGARRKE